MKRRLAIILTAVALSGCLAGCEVATVALFGGIVVAGNALQPDKPKVTEEQREAYGKKFHESEMARNRH